MDQSEIIQQLTDLVRDLAAKLAVEQGVVVALVSALASRGILDVGWLDEIRSAKPSVAPVLEDAVRYAIDERVKLLERVLARSKG